MNTRGQDNAAVDGINGDERVADNRVESEVIASVALSIAERSRVAAGNGLKIFDTGGPADAVVPVIVVLRQAIGHAAEHESVIRILREENLDIAV
jgi:hypothetical protein